MGAGKPAARAAALVAACAAAAAFMQSTGAQAAPLPPSGTLDLTTDAEITLTLPSSRGVQAATTVAPAGDVNGDGLGDAIVGARLQDPRGREDAGSAFVVFGRSQGGTVNLEELGAGGLRIDGAAAGDRAGFHVNRLGDVNGDGFADVLVGAPYADSAVGVDSGSAYVVFGAAGNTPIDLAEAGPRVVRISGAHQGDHVGWSATGTGDQDGDGRADALIGAPGEGEFGTAYMLSGLDGPGERFLDTVGARTVRYTGSRPGRLGWSVSAVTDMTGDGVPELLLGTPALDREGQLSNAAGVGGAWIVFGGRRDPGGEVDLAALGGGGAFFQGELEPDPIGDAAGNYVTGLGDINKDGKGDFAISAHFSDPGKKKRAGTMYVVLGSPEAGKLRLTQLGARAVRVDGANPGDEAGHSFAPAGDFDSDGTQDTAVVSLYGSPLSRENAGAVTILFGHPGELVDLSAVGDRGVRLAPATRMDHLGPKVAGLGDFTADGTADVILGGILDLPDGKEHAPVGYIVSGPRKVVPPPPDPGQVEEETIDKCTAAGNVEVVIDDSGSMSDTDPQRLRKQATELLLAKPRSVGRVLGAVEFGDEAETLFAPQVIVREGAEANVEQLTKTLEERTGADNGSTNYNAAFSVLADENPGADARIFLTDGAHNVGEYLDLHKNGPPTYVIGLGIGRKGVDGERLSLIARDTKGLYFPRVTAAKLQPVMNAIDARLNCDIEVDDFVNTLTRDDPRPDPREVDIEDGAYSADVHVSWDETDDRVEFASLELLDEDGDIITKVGATLLKKATQFRRPRHKGSLTLLGSRGPTFATVRVRGLDGGKTAKRIRVGLRARKVGGKRARATTQITQSRRRK